MYKYADEVPVLTVDADPMAGSLSAGEDRETVEIPYELVWDWYLSSRKTNLTLRRWSDNFYGIGSPHSPRPTLLCDYRTLALVAEVFPIVRKLFAFVNFGLNDNICTAAK